MPRRPARDPGWRLLARDGRAGILALVPVANVVANVVALWRITRKPWWWFVAVPAPLAGFVATLITIFIVVTSMP